LAEGESSGVDVTGTRPVTSVVGAPPAKGTLMTNPLTASVQYADDLYVVRGGRRRGVEVIDDGQHSLDQALARAML
jgi:hypothetical protein